MSKVRMVTLEVLRPAMSLGPEHFVGRYPGCFLLAVGLVAAREVEGEGEGEDASTDHGRQTREWQLIDDTATVDFGERLTHGMDDHPLAGRAYHFDRIGPEQTLIAGRGMRCDLLVPDPSVSERHCSLRLLAGQGQSTHEADRLVVTDLNSTNGTWIDLSQLMPGMPRQLIDEGLLTIGRYSFQFYRAVSLYRALQLLGSL